MCFMSAADISFLSLLYFVFDAAAHARHLGFNLLFLRLYGHTKRSKEEERPELCVQTVW